MIMNSLFVVFLALFLGSAHCLYTASSPVQILDHSFNSRIKSTGMALVEFYAPWYVCVQAPGLMNLAYEAEQICVRAVQCLIRLQDR